MRYKKAVIVIDRNQMTIKKPVYRARQSKAVLHHIWAADRNRLDVCGLNFGPSPSIHNSKTRDRTAIAVGSAN